MKRFVCLGIVFGTLSVAGCLPDCDRDRIVFISERDGNREVYVMDLDGGTPINLTNHSAEDIDAAVCPKGTKIVFVSDRDLNYEIYTMSIDGTNLKRLTFNTDRDESPHFGPDGATIVFMSDRDGGWPEIYKMNADGTGQSRLTTNDWWDVHPVFKPDGSVIVYHINIGGIQQMNPNGSGIIPLTSEDDSYPAFNPAGTQIAFNSHRDGGPYPEIYVMNADGSNQTPLTNNPEWDGMPAFTTDGARIAFESERNGVSGIYIMNRDGTSVRRLTDHDTDFGPAFPSSP